MRLNKEGMKKLKVIGGAILMIMMTMGGMVSGGVTREQRGWSIETIDSIGDVGFYTSLDLDDSGYPHISHHDFTNGDLKYAYKDSTGWHNETVESTGNIGWWTSLALDTNGYPHISYRDNTNGDLKYAYKDGTGWHNETVDYNGDVGYETSLALDTNGYPHISHYDYTNGDLKYAYKDGTGWHNETVESIGDVGRCTSLALDTNGYPHISHYDFTTYVLKYAYKDGTGWHNETVDSNGDVGWFSSLTLYNSRYPHISYYDYTHGDLKYAMLSNIDFIQITYGSIDEIGDQVISTNFSLVVYAAAFNATYGLIDFIDVTWNMQNSGGSNASINTTTGKLVEIYTGWHNGTATLTADDGDGHSDSVVFTIDQSAFSMMIGCGWNLIGWFQDYSTNAETLGQYIPECTVVSMYDWLEQRFITHVVGVPHDNFTITQGMGLFIYTTKESIWDGTA